MFLPGPTLDELKVMAKELGFSLSDYELASLGRAISSAQESYHRLDALPEPRLPTRYPRESGHRPHPGENPLNAWYWKCSIKGNEEGRLRGKRIAIKDNVCVAAVPMMVGSAILEGFTPDFDATVATRILDAGGEITGKAVCEHLCLSGSSFTSDTGPVLNPYSPDHSAGGSSSGSAALVATSECDMAIGGDQGGSIRVPAAWCGIYGLKPTYGLVPYTGAFPLEMTLDHLGPMAANVEDLALLLTVIAGEDGLDPRQQGIQTNDYLTNLDGGVQGLRVGILRDAFECPGISQPEVDNTVHAAAEVFEKGGALVQEISVPMHRDGVHIWNGIAYQGITALVMNGSALGTNWKGYYCTSLGDFFGQRLETMSDRLSDPAKFIALSGYFMQRRYRGHYYSRAQNLGRVLRRAYDEALERVDILVMPTTPLLPTRLPDSNTNLEERLGRALEKNPNSCPFNVTGHPAISVPCGRYGNLPVGMMLVGRHWKEATLLRAARFFEVTN